MKTKLIVGLLTSVMALFIGYLYFSISPINFIAYNQNCPFCDPKVVNAQKFYEDDLVIALYTHKPIVPGHCLIIPKRHVVRFENLNDPEFVAIGNTIKKVNKAVSKVFRTSAYLLLQKNGIEVGQTVPHVHVHYIPRKAGDSSTIKFLFAFYFSNFKKPIPEHEMKEIVEKLKTAISTS